MHDALSAGAEVGHDVPGGDQCFQRVDGPGDVTPGDDRRIEALRRGRRKRRYHAQQVIFSGGVLGTVDLLLALKGATPEMQALVLRNMSNRAGADVRDELEIMGPTPRSMVTRAQENIVEIALRLADEQVIFLPLGGGDELI